LVVWAASVWYWARVVLMVRSRDEPDPTPDELFFATWTPRVLGTATVALAGVAFLLTIPAAMADPRAARIMGLFAIVCLILALAFGLVVMRRRTWLARRRPLPVEASFTTEIPLATRAVAVVSLGVSLLFFVLFAWSPPRAEASAPRTGRRASSRTSRTSGPTSRGTSSRSAACREAAWAPASSRA